MDENLAWRYSDPFVGWYDQEKYNYETNNGGQTRDYLNIIEGSYGITVFAIAKRGGNSYGITHGQTFYFTGEGSTPDEYLASLGEYKAYLDNAEGDHQSAKAIADAAAAELEKITAQHRKA